MGWEGSLLWMVVLELLAADTVTMVSFFETSYGCRRLGEMLLAVFFCVWVA